MKNVFIALIATALAMSAKAQDSTVVKTDTTHSTKDTVRIGKVTIIKDSKNPHSVYFNSNDTTPRKLSNVSTNWFIIDLGFANFSDKTNYGTGAAQTIAPGFTKENFDLRNGKSVNVNIWIVMQKVNLIQHVVNLKYGLGLELNNYRFNDKQLRLYNDQPIFRHDLSATDVKKNKLAADYLTAPLMLNFNFTPHSKKKSNFGFSAGVSAGYLYSSRQKIKTNDDKHKTHGDYDLEPFKISYIGELSLGRLRFYGSYATKSMWKNGIDQTPYTVGIRFSKW